MAATVKIATRGPAARHAVTAITSMTTGQGEPISASVSALRTDRTPATIPSNTSPPAIAAASIRASIHEATTLKSVPLPSPRKYSETSRSGKVSSIAMEPLAVKR